MFMANGAVAQNSSKGCTSNVFGEACWIGSATTPLTRKDYGAIWVEFTPPKDIITLHDKALRKSLGNSVLRYFKKDTKSVSIVLELYDHFGAKVATIPLALASVDTKAGIDVDDNVKLMTSSKIGSYFLIQDPADVTKATITVVYSSKPTTELLPIITDVVKTATEFGAHGWLSSAVTNATITSGLGGIEKRINDHFAVAANSTLEIPLNFGTASRLEYRFGFDPRPGAAQTGFLAIDLKRRPSLWTDETTTATVGQGGRAVPDYHTGGEMGADITGTFLGYRVSATKTVGDLIEDKVSAPIMSSFRSAATPLPAFELACDAVQRAAESTDLSLSPDDSVAASWASFVRSGNADRGEVQANGCIKRQLPAFKSHGLAVPIVPVKPPPKDDPEPATKSDLSGVALKGDRLEAWLDKRLIRALLPNADRIAKQNNLEPLFAAQTIYRSKLVDTDPASTGLNNLTETESARAIAEKLATADFIAGCFVPMEAEKTLMLARRSDAAAASMTSPLWAFELSIRSLPSGGPLPWVASLHIRQADTDDIVLIKQRLPKAPRCHDLATAPGAG